MWLFFCVLLRSSAVPPDGPFCWLRSMANTGHISSLGKGWNEASQTSWCNLHKWENWVCLTSRKKISKLNTGRGRKGGKKEKRGHLVSIREDKMVHSEAFYRPLRYWEASTLPSPSSSSWHNIKGFKRPRRVPSSKTNCNRYWGVLTLWPLGWYQWSDAGYTIKHNKVVIAGAGRYKCEIQHVADKAHIGWYYKAQVRGVPVELGCLETKQGIWKIS